MRKVNVTQIKENICTWIKDHKKLILCMGLCGMNSFIWYKLGKVVQKDSDTLSMQPTVNFAKDCSVAVPKGVRFNVHAFRNESIGEFNDMNRVVEILDDPESRKEVLGAVLFTQ